MRKELNVSLARRTTLGLGGVCAAELVLEEEGDLERLPAELEALSLPVLVVARGSNILALDGRHEHVLVRPMFAGRPRLVGSDGDGRILVEAAAGLPLPALLAFCREQGLTGLEGLSGIPGSVGGAVAMNAGSFGVSLCERLASVRVWQDNRLETLGPGQFSFAYRHFAPLQGTGTFFFVVSAVLALEKGVREEVAEQMARTLALKKARQPVGARSAGCVFKNPPSGPSAGVLLDRAGFRGRVHGGVELSAMHANFLVNRGNGTASEAVELLREARAAVAEQFRVQLEPEVRGLPCRFL